MNEEKSNRRILLVQARDPQFAQHEIKCILEQTDLDKSELIVHDAVTNSLVPELADNFDAIIWGGSGKYNVSKNEPEQFIEQYLEVIREWIKLDVPFLGVCYGGHLLAKALGGEVILSPKQKEVGTTELILRDEAKDDLLFSDLPGNFTIGVGHVDAISKLPDDAIALADTQLVKYHAFRIPNKRLIYGLQFHPELSRQGIIERTTMVYERNKKYIKDKNELQKVIDQLVETPISNTIIQRFLDLL